MELQILNNGISIPVIGIGPAGVGFSGYSKGVTGIHLYAEKIYKKFIKNPSIEKKWVGNLAEAFNMGYTLLDNSAFSHSSLINLSLFSALIYFLKLKSLSFY